MTKPRFTMVPMALAALALSGAVALADTGIKTGESALGPVLTDANGMTLYRFDKDSGDVSACYEKCAANWPPLLAPANARKDGGFGVIKRTDGTKQWTQDGKPLYLWIKDKTPGDVTGDGFNEVWRVAKPTK